MRRCGGGLPGNGQPRHTLPVPPTASLAAVRPLQAVISLCLVTMCAAVLVHQVAGWRTAALVSSGCFVAYFVIGQRNLRLRERGLLAAALALTGLAYAVSAAPAALIEQSLQRAAFLAAFMVLLALLREGAAASSAVLSLGVYLTRQPPNRRYLSIHAGSHVMGVLLNFGALSLIGPLIKRGVEATRAADPAAAAIREERQFSALVRGFSWIIAWSPTAVTQALMPVAIIGADPVRLAGMGAAVAVMLFPLAWFMDRMTGSRARRRLAAAGRRVHRPVVAFPRGAALRFGLVCLALAGLSALVVLTSDVIVIVALMLAAPVVTLGWLFVQARMARRNDPDAPDFGAAAAALALVAMPRSMPEALTLATGGYCGLMLAGLVDPAAVAAHLQLDRLPAMAVYPLAAAIVPILSNLALPPILVATFFGSLLSSVPGLGLDPTLLGFSLVMGWCLNLTGSPFGATALVLGRATGVPGTTITWRWNGRFTLVSYAFVVAALVVFA